MRTMLDRTGRRYGKLTVIEYAGKDEHRNILWRCRCDCGNEVVRTAKSLCINKNSSCGCAVPGDVIKRRTGQKYGKLTIIGDAGRNKHGNILWRCRCDCGNEVIRSSSSLQPNRNCNCGCEGRKGAARIKGDSISYNAVPHTICWNCIRSAAPPSLQCIWDKTKGTQLPDGAEYMQNAGTRWTTLVVTKCPEYMPLTEKSNMELLEQERHKNSIQIAKELGERALTVGDYGHDRSASAFGGNAK